MLIAFAALLLLLQGYFIASLLLRDPVIPVPVEDLPSKSTLAEQTDLSEVEHAQTENNTHMGAGESVGQPQPPRRSLRWLRLALTPGLGMGSVSMVYFFWRAILGTPNYTFVGFEIAVTLVLFALYLRAGLRPFRRGLASHPKVKVPFWWVILPITFALGVAGFLLIYLMGRSLFPQGHFDAWMIWNLAARYLSIGNTYWKNLFSSDFYHADYPLLLAANIARFWTYLGQQADWVPQVFSIAFAVSLIGLGASSVSILRGRLVGLLAGLGMLAAASLGVLSAAQTADIPLAYFYLASLILIYLVEVGYTKDVRRTMILAGLAAGLAAWTKNEGWLFLLALLAVKLLPHWRSPFRSQKYAPWIWFGLGLLPVLSLVILFKIIYAPPNDLIAGQNINTLIQLFDPTRYAQIGVRFIEQLGLRDAKSTTPYLFLAIFLLVAGIEPGALRRSENRSLIYLILLMLGGFFMTYIVSPLELEFHLRTSVFRIFLQLWPIAVFLVMMIANLPGIASTWQNNQPAESPAKLNESLLESPPYPD